MYKYLLLFGLLFSAGSVFSAQVDGKLVCPDGKREGLKLVCEVQLVNFGCFDVQIKRGMAIFVGNSGGTLGGAGIWGPFVRSNLTNQTIPAHDCISTPGTFTAGTLIIDPVPTISPTVGMAMIQIELIDLNPAVGPLYADDEITVDAMVQIR